MDVDEWMDEYRDLEQFSRDILALIQYRNRSEPHDRNESAESRKMFASFAIRLKSLSDLLSRADELGKLSDGEILRRRDLLENLKLEKENLSRLLSAYSQSEERAMLLAGQSLGTSLSRTRVFGVPLIEHEDTKHLDSRGLLELQNEMISNQETHLDSLYSSVIKQKDLSLAIGAELDHQNQILADLESKVDTTSARIHIATKAADKLL